MYYYFFLSNGRQFRERNALAYLIFEVLLQTGVGSRTDGCFASHGFALANL